jgi:hypothetical protein
MTIRRFELSDSDVRELRKRLKLARSRRGDANEEEILESAERILGEARATMPPAFALQSLVTLERLMAMLQDSEWRLPGGDRARILELLVYFVDSGVMIPDRLPGIVGYLDVAIMVKLIDQELKHETKAYEDFCEFRRLQGRKKDPADLEARRIARQSRIRRGRGRLELRSSSRSKPALGLWGERGEDSEPLPLEKPGFLSRFRERFLPSRREEGATGQEAERVLLGASAPRACLPGREFTARFVAYAQHLEEEVRGKLAKLSPRSESHLALEHCRWKLGTVVKVVAHGDHISLDPPEQHFEWQGQYNLVSFDVRIAEDVPSGTTVLKLDAYVADIRIARLRLDLEITRASPTGEHQETQAEPVRSAFASYASEDRARVLDRVASVRTSTGMDIFVDCLSLHPGDEWKRRLHSEIEERDLFLLFWSRHAVVSPWVEWEYKEALDIKGIEAMQLHPLDPVEEAPPPSPLEALHFGDPLMQLRRSYNGAT